MTDYAEEKSAELEILESIYSENYSISDSGKTFSVFLKAEEDEDDHEARKKEEFGVAPLGNFCTVITFSHPAKYPDEAINFEIHDADQSGTLIKDIRNRDSSQAYSQPTWLRELIPQIEEQIEENLEMQQAFIVTSFVQEYLTEKCESLNEARKERIEELKEEAENAHTKKLIGTPVTLETFTRWQINFQTEMEKIFAEKQSQRERDQQGRMTGKTLFANKLAKTEDDIDLSGINLDGEGGGTLAEKITVDEALFEEDFDLEDLDDLDLTDEEEGGAGGEVAVEG